MPTAPSELVSVVMADAKTPAPSPARPMMPVGVSVNCAQPAMTVGRKYVVRLVTQRTRNVTDHAPVPVVVIAHRRNRARPATETAATDFRKTGDVEAASTSGGAASANVDSSKNGEDWRFR